MEYIYSVINGGNTYSVYSRKKVSNQSVIISYGICAESPDETVYVPDITTVRDIALCMIKVISGEMVSPEKLHNVIYNLIS